jgi:hypothetical protein
MSKCTATTVIVEIVSSQIDRNGNRYHFAIFYNPAKGRQRRVCMEVGGESNARTMAYELAEKDFERILTFECTLPKREWQRRRTLANCVTYEGSPEAKAALAALFNVKG